MYNKYDKIKIKISLYDVGRVNENLFSCKKDKDGNLIHREYDNSGLNILINYYKKEVYITFSALVLKEHYGDKIHIENIGKVLNEVRKLIEIKPYLFYRSYPVYCEVTNDILVQDISNTIDVLHQYAGLQTKYKISNLKKQDSKPTSFWLKKNVTSRQVFEYVSIYNKQNELKKWDNNKRGLLYENLSYDEIKKIEMGFKDKLRFESTFNNRQAIKAIFKFNKGFDLFDLLFINKNINLLMFDKIYNLDVIDSLSPSLLSIRQFDKYNTLVRYNYDLELLWKHLVLSGIKGQKSKVLKPYKQILSIVNNKKNNDNNNSKKIIEFIKNELKW